MIDGIKILVRNIDFLKWKALTGISFTLDTDCDTGVVWGRINKNDPNTTTYFHKGKFETYKLTVKETQTIKHGVLVRRTYHLFIEGSLHRNFFHGKNYDRFFFDDLQVELNKFRKKLFLKLKECYIQNIEAGVNVRVPFLVKFFIDNCLLLHSTKAFENYDPDKTGYILGKRAIHTQHSVKSYDKGGQYSLDYHLMRFEDKITKMQYLKTHKQKIRTLEDLTDINKVSALGKLLLKVWDDVLIYEPDVKEDGNSFTPTQKQLIHDGLHRDYWIYLLKDSQKKFNKKREMFRGLMAKHSQLNTHSLIKILIQQEWELLIQGSGEDPVIPIGDIFTVYPNGKNVPIISHLPNLQALPATGLQ